MGYFKEKCWKKPGNPILRRQVWKWSHKLDWFPLSLDKSPEKWGSPQISSILRCIVMRVLLISLKWQSSWVSMKADVLLLIFCSSKTVKYFMFEKTFVSHRSPVKCAITVKSQWRVSDGGGNWITIDWFPFTTMGKDEWNVVNITLLVRFFGQEKKTETKENKIEISLFVTWSYPWYAWYAGTQGGVVNNRMVSSPKIR